MTGVVTIGVLLALGLILLVVEVALIPGFGLIGLLGMLLTGVGCLVAWESYGALPGVATVGGAFTITLGIVWWASRSRSGQRLVLEKSTEGDSGPVSELEALVGKTGLARAPLRPGGIAEIDGERYDVVADGGVWVEPGDGIKVIRVATNSIIVAKTED